MQNNERPWFRGAVIYQIYPRSFYDSNDDGVGDLPGIIEKLDYLAGTPDSLGVNAIWLSPFYPSPMADFGYDIADYRGVDPIFGTIEDFKRLIDEAHKRNLKVLIDFVPNHTSDQHPWFTESRSSRDNPKHDWYVWKDPGPNGEPPNNWLSVIEGKAWEFDHQRGQYYLHSFMKAQPDLNWDNPEVREEMKNTVRFWLDLGVDGLRVDAVLYMSKDPEFKDDPPNPNPGIWSYSTLLHNNSRHGPNLFVYLSELAQLVNSYGDRFMITEAYFDVNGNINGYLDFYYHLDPNVCAPFNFEAINMDWQAEHFWSHFDAYQSVMRDDFEPIYCLGNHDQSRLASRVGRAEAKVANVMLLTLPGIPFIYYGDELGMVDVQISPELVADPMEKHEPGKGLGRDPERTPMQWSHQFHAGFSKSEPWLPISPDFAENNVVSESSDPQSHLQLTKKLLKLRNSSSALKYGSYESLEVGDGIFAYYRSLDDEKLLVLLNFKDHTTKLDKKIDYKEILISTSGKTDGNSIEELQADEAVVVSI